MTKTACATDVTAIMATVLEALKKDVTAAVAEAKGQYQREGVSSGRSTSNSAAT